MRSADPKAIWFSMRPKQWVKNLFVFAGLLFSGNLFNVFLLAEVIAGFALLSIAAGSIYIFNDVMDVAKDRQHPQKLKRPIASGQLSVPAAYAVSAVLALAALAGAYLLNPSFCGIVGAFLAVNLVYSLKIKEIVILDVMFIACSFVLRALAGTILIDVRASEWLILCTAMIALFLGFCKRRHEIVWTKGAAIKQRIVLGEYGVGLLDQMIAVATAGSIITYAMYTVSNGTVTHYGTRDLMYTVPFVIFGVYRYLYLIHQKSLGEDPTSLIFNDISLLLNAILWIAAVIYILY